MTQELADAMKPTLAELADALAEAAVLQESIGVTKKRYDELRDFLRPYVRENGELAVEGVGVAYFQHRKGVGYDVKSLHERFPDKLPELAELDVLKIDHKAVLAHKRLWWLKEFEIPEDIVAMKIERLRA